MATDILLPLNSKAIPLAGCGGDKYTIVDDNIWFRFLIQFKWYADKNGKNCYARRNLYDPGSRKPYGVKMHRLIVGAAKGQVVDHVNGNGLDNRLCNLRICTQGENTMNQSAKTYMNRTKSSVYKGVIFHRCSGKWQASITVNQTTRHLGSFRTEAEAALAYNAAAITLFGEFARLNILP